MFVALLASAALMAGSPAAAQPAEPTAAPATAPAEAKSEPKKTETGGNKLICRSEAVLGSRLPVKRCRTSQAIAQERAEDQRNLDKIQRRPDYGH